MELEEKLNRIVARGIDVDAGRIKEDMCAQFTDPNEWIREFAVNAADARAESCHISAHGDKKSFTVVVEDDGCGMDRKGVMDFCNIFRSVKKGDTLRTVGTHGVGKLSPAAVPGQRGFVMTTSTGEECWRMAAGCLLNNAPIRIDRMEPVSPKGTRFEITFDNRDGSTSGSKLKEYADLLEHYLRHFGLRIVLFETDQTGSNGPKWAKPVRRIQGDWETEAERMGRSDSFRLAGCSFDAVMGLGAGEHELYQKKVLVTEKYNLLSYDLSEELTVPHLKIRVDSPDFRLPFGRNRLSNEEVLAPLSRSLRREILPKYFDQLYVIYEVGRLKDYGIEVREMEEIACALLLHDETSKTGHWTNLPLFHAMNSPTLSFLQLKQSSLKHGMFYFEKQQISGTDYRAFNAPVISGTQPQGALEVLKKHFSEWMMILGADDAIVEMTEACRPGLGEKEKGFEKCLGFQRAAARQAGSGRHLVRKNNVKQALAMFLEKGGRFKSSVEAHFRAEKDLSTLKWRVNYLVHRNGKTPCRTHQFILKGDTVVLNMNHSVIRQLFQLSETDSALAGHLAMVMCLNHEGSILAHITPEKRDELLMLDAVCRVEGAEAYETRERKQPPGDRRFRDFLRDLEDSKR